jgi:hypothetical protein
MSRAFIAAFAVATDAGSQRDASHFGRVDDALAHEIAELARLGVEAVGVGVILNDLADHDRAVLACTDGDLARQTARSMARLSLRGDLAYYLGAHILEAAPRVRFPWRR